MFVLGEVRGFIGIQHVEGGAYRPEEIELAQALAHHVMIAAHGAELGEQRRHAVVFEGAHSNGARYSRYACARVHWSDRPDGHSGRSPEG